MAWWQDTYKYAKLVVSLVAKTDRHDTEIKELQAENRRLSALVQQLIFERQRDRDHAEYTRQLAEKDTEVAAKDRELLLMRLDAKLLQYERRLTPPSGSEDQL